MRLSTKTTYGVRALAALAAVYGQKSLMVKEIAERENLPATYLEQIMVPLRKARLVLGTRGAGGGYVLSRPPAEINLAEVIEALEGPIELAECPPGAGCGGHPESCAHCELWQEASQVLAGFFSKITLKELTERQLARQAGPVLTYEI